MKLTQSQLQKIIREELNEAVRGKQRAHLEREAERVVAKELALADAAEIEEALGSRFRVTMRELEGRYQITVAKTADARAREEKTQRMIDGYLNRYPDSRPKDFGVRSPANLFERPGEEV